MLKPGSNTKSGSPAVFSATLKKMTGDSTTLFCRIHANDVTSNTVNIPMRYEAVFRLSSAQMYLITRICDVLTDALFTLTLGELDA
jgi:hypothetical protein